MGAGDSSEITQEMASRGMSRVYGLGDESSRSELLGSLVGTLQGDVLCLVTTSGGPW